MYNFNHHIKIDKISWTYSSSTATWLRRIDIQDEDKRIATLHIYFFAFCKPSEEHQNFNDFLISLWNRFLTLGARILEVFIVDDNYLCVCCMSVAWVLHEFCMSFAWVVHECCMSVEKQLKSWWLSPFLVLSKSDPCFQKCGSKSRGINEGKSRVSPTHFFFVGNNICQVLT